MVLSFAAGLLALKWLSSWLERVGGAKAMGTELKDLDFWPEPEERPDYYIDFDETGPACVAPADLYSHHARQRIVRLLEGWLGRNKVIPFELLHAILVREPSLNQFAGTLIWNALVVTQYSWQLLLVLGALLLAVRRDQRLRFGMIQ